MSLTAEGDLSKLVPCPLLGGSFFFLNGNGIFAFPTEGFGGREGGGAEGATNGVEVSSSSPSSGDEVNSRLERLSPSGDLEAFRFLGDRPMEEPL